MYGWMGTILHVDLTDSKITRLPTQPYAEQYVGGRGMASRIYWETVAPDVKAFDPDNRLVFMTGPLVATGVQGAARLSVIGKSPMTLPEGYCYANIGGFVGPELKKAGFDGAVIEGRAPKPVYLWIHDGEAEILDASSMWGQGAYRTGEMLQQAHGEKTRFLSTGVAGERKVRAAVIAGPHHSASSAGFGAVMGSKNLKALALLGSGKPSVADPARLKELNSYTAKISKASGASIPSLMFWGEQGKSLEVKGRGNCYQCGLELGCNRRLFRYGPGLEGYRKCQSMDYYLPWRYSREDEPVDTIFDAPTLANDYSVCTWELQSMIDWLYACYKAGVLTEQETGLPLSKIGTREFLEKLMHSIAYREGFGDVLAEGLVRIDGKVSDEARALFTRSLAPIGQNDWNPPRVYIFNALLYPMEPRVHHNILHETHPPIGAWDLNRRQPGKTGVTSQVFRNMAKAFWGSEEAGDFSSYEGKALAAKMIQNRTYLKESLGLCDFAYPILYDPTTPDHVGDPHLDAKLFNAVTGTAGEELDRCGERICNQQRIILLREWRKVPEADFPLEFNFTESYCEGTHLIEAVPGPDEEVFDPRGRTLDRDKFTGMLHEYYNLRGWDEETGIPRPETLAALGLQE